MFMLCYFSSNLILSTSEPQEIHSLKRLQHHISRGKIGKLNKLLQGKFNKHGVNMLEMYILSISDDLKETRKQEKSWRSHLKKDSRFELLNVQLKGSTAIRRKKPSVHSVYIYQLKNNINNKIFLSSAANDTDFRKNIFDKLATNCHPNQQLQQEFNKFGIINFSITVEKVSDSYTSTKDLELAKNKLSGDHYSNLEYKSIFPTEKFLELTKMCPAGLEPAI